MHSRKIILQRRGEEDNHDAPRPYSETKVINDLAVADAKDDSMMMNHEGKENTKKPFDPALVISVIALGAALGSLWMQKKRGVNKRELYLRQTFRAVQKAARFFNKESDRLFLKRFHDKPKRKGGEKR